MATRTNTTRMSRNALKCHRAARRRSKEQKPSNTVCYDVMLQHYGLESSGPINHYKKEVCRRRASITARQIFIIRWKICAHLS